MRNIAGFLSIMWFLVYFLCRWHMTVSPMFNRTTIYACIRHSIFKFGNPIWYLVFIQVPPLIFIPCKVKAFLSFYLWPGFSSSFSFLRVKVVVCSETTVDFRTPKFLLWLTNVNKAPARHHREVSSELKPHCIGSSWRPAVRKKLFCRSTRSISESQGDGVDQPWDF